MSLDSCEVNEILTLVFLKSGPYLYPLVKIQHLGLHTPLIPLGLVS